MVTFTINVPPMLAYIPYMDPVGLEIPEPCNNGFHHQRNLEEVPQNGSHRDPKSF
jgi:hypothetical protein